MNRFAPPLGSQQLDSLIPAPPVIGIGSALADRPVRRSVQTPLATFLPRNYEPGYAYPLIVWLHETGGSERHLPQVMQHLSTQNYVAVAPRGPRECNQTGRGFRWVQQPAAIAEAEEAVSSTIDHAKARFNIHSERVFLVGHGAGGSMAMRLATQRPELYAGVATLSGKLPRSHAPLRNINRVRSLPFLIASAREFSAYPESQVCNDLRLLHAAGCSVALRQYPGNDDLTTTMLSDVNHWIMDRVCGN